MDWTQIILAVIGIIPTILIGWLDKQRKKDKDEMMSLSERNAAKSSIQNMITQDIIRTELLHKLPENRDNIEAEYTIYHANGGNGTITRQVNEYQLWFETKEKEVNAK